MTKDVGETISGKYRLLKLIGKGGMGSVYEAEHTVLGRRVAIKLLNPEYASDQEIVARFVREAKAASAIGHPNIIDVQDVGEDDGKTYIVMELLEGTSLAGLIKNRGCLAPAHVVSIARQVIDGLEAAHDKGIVHRDLKADNVFVIYDSRLGEQIKILDFGISKVVEADGTELTQTGAVIGTPHYMAPEQVRAEKDVDSRIDVWALGVMMYQMLTGEFPFPGACTPEVLVKILTEPARPLERPGLPDELVEVVERALEKDRSLRFASVSDLREALATLEACAGALPSEAHEIESAATIATPSVGGDATHATTGVESGEATRSTQAPLWKYIVWYLVAVPIAASGFVGLLRPGDTNQGLGLPQGESATRALVIVGVFAVVLIAAAFLISRFWSGKKWNRWLQGPLFTVFPVAGLLYVLYRFLTLRGQLESHLLTLRSYAEISADHASRIAEQIGHTHYEFLSAARMDFGFVCQLSLLVLLGYLFVRKRKGAGGSGLRWLVLPAALLVIVAVELLYAEVLEFMGPVRLLFYMTWTVTAVTLLRVGRTRVAGVQPGWNVLAAGAIGFAALSGMHVVMGYVAVAGFLNGAALEQISPATREWLLGVEVNPSMTGGIIVLWVLMTIKFTALAVVCRRSLPLSGIKRVAPFAITLAVTAAPTVIVLMAMQQVDLQWTPYKFARMHSVTSSDTPFYIDREPESLSNGVNGLCAALTDRPRMDCEEPDLAGALAGAGECQDIVGSSPARCVTAIEARLFCEGAGKRLPTPDEWERALGAAARTENDVVGGGELGEWTMRMVHGTAAFEIKGGVTASAEPRKLEPTEFAKDVGFRCAFSFDE